MYSYYIVYITVKLLFQCYWDTWETNFFDRFEAIKYTLKVILTILLQQN